MRIRILRFSGMLLIGLLLLTGTVVAISDLSTVKLTPIEAWFEEDLVAEWGMVLPAGIVVEIKIETQEEIKIWPNDLAIGYIVDGQEYRVPAYAITNAVSDPEDERTWRFTSPITVRKGTRYFYVLFGSSFALDSTQTINKNLSSIRFLSRIVIPGELTVTMPEIEYDYYDDDYYDEDYYDDEDWDWDW